MPKLIEQIKHTVDATIPDKEELTHGLHPKIDYALLVLRNFFVAAAVILFIISFIPHDSHNIFKAIAYFCGAAAYLFECLAVTDCFQTKVPIPKCLWFIASVHIILMGISYILWY